MLYVDTLRTSGFKCECGNDLFLETGGTFLGFEHHLFVKCLECGNDHTLPPSVDRKFLDEVE